MRAVLGVIKKMVERVEELKSKTDYLRGLIRAVVPINDGMPKTKSQRSKVDFLTAAIIDNEREQSELEEIIELCRGELYELLDKKIFSAEIVRIMFERYGQLKKFSEIAREMNFSEASIFRLHRTGLLRLGITKVDSAPKVA